MHSNIRPTIAFAVACVGCLATALLALPVAAGVNSWTAIGPIGAIVGPPFAVDPSSPSTIYLTVGGVVMKTTDGGGHWAEMANGATLDSHVTNSLVIDPAFPATIYIGRGNSAQHFDDGPVYKSIDGGAHWADASNGLPNLASTGIETLAVAASPSSTLYAILATRGVFKSIDSGVSWQQVNSGLPADAIYTALAIDPTNADTVYVATAPIPADSDANVFQSTDGGGQWRQVPISGPAAAVITTLAVDPAVPSTIFASYGFGTDDFENAPSGFIFKSINSGVTWTAAQSALSRPTGFVYALAIDPSVSRRIYAATQQGVFMSTDFAASWTPINDGLTGPDLNVLAISIDGNGSILRAATSAGLFEYQMTIPPSAGAVAVIEYFNAMFDDYFVTANPHEISELDNGAFPGWARTGLQFNAYATLEVPAVPVCRFFSTGFAPKSTHFYTPFASECSTLRLDSNWELESASAFAIALPGADGVCAAGLIPVYRLYNLNQGGVPNHRYTTDTAVRAQMMTQGWVAEGLGPNAVEMCSPM